MSTHVSAGAHHTYRANEHDTVLSEVSRVICVLLPRSFLIAGFNGDGHVAMARYNSYEHTDPAWDKDFFEQEFMNEPLLGVPQQVRAVFIGSREGMLIPSTLYNEGEARKWMTKLQSVCPDDVLHSYGAESADAQYAFALPAAMDKLLRRYFGETPVLPLAAYQFYKPVKAGYILQCFAAEDVVTASLHQLGRLLWHQQFTYSGVEDIAWQAVYVCRELHIPRIDLQIQLTMLCDDCYDLGPELERYFPKIKWSLSLAKDEGRWAPVLYLLQQLYVCAL